MPTIPSPSLPLLAVRALAFSRDEVLVFGPLAFSVEANQALLVQGGNGAGKTTLLRVLAGLLRADAGVIRLGGESFAHVPPARLPGLGVARTFQNLALFPGLSVAQNIASGLVFRRERSLVTLGILIALGAEHEMQAHFKIARQNGLTNDELAEVIYHSIGYAGFPAANTARGVAAKVLGD